MDSRNVLEKLQTANPKAEIWWDSAPMVYGSWKREVLEKAPNPKKELWADQLALGHHAHVRALRGARRRSSRPRPGPSAPKYPSSG
jgi:hypothetical protein